jgi:autotransporter-like protein
MQTPFQPIEDATSQASDGREGYPSDRSLLKKNAVSSAQTRGDALSKRSKRATVNLSRNASATGNVADPAERRPTGGKEVVMVSDVVRWSGASLPRMLSRGHWLCSAILIALASPAAAQTIDTTAAWNGSSAIGPWDTVNTPTIGQVITPTSGQTKLSSFTFELRDTSASTVQYQAFVYQWAGASNGITGPALFTSAVLTAPSAGTFTPVTINTGSVALTAGVQYILFFSAVLPQAGTGSYQLGVTPSAAYTAGGAQYAATTGFSNLSGFPWGTPGSNLAFIAMFGSSGSSPAPFIPLFTPLLPSGAPINPTNVAGALDKFSNAGGALPAGFLTLFLSGSPGALVSGLSQLSGENNADAQQGAFQLMNSYLSLLTDPHASNRTNGGGALGYAPAPSNARAGDLPNAITSANASIPMKAQPAYYEPRWDSWGAAFGGSSINRGDATVVGSHDSTADVSGLAAGADYHFSRDTLVGFSLAGGATSWNLADGLGNGHSDVFLGGVYGSHRQGAAYVSGALTYANYWMTTERTVTVAGSDSLQANFNAQNVGGRLEGGYRIPTQWMVDITPFAAVQVQSFHTPAYGEVAVGGSSSQFALNFNARDATDIRTELGTRTDKTWQLADASALNLFGKATWAHDAVSDPQLSASFIGLTPIASFVVNGAAPSHDLALLSSGVEWRFASGLSVMAKFDGEFSSRTTTYAGTGRLRYTW